MLMNKLYLQKLINKGYVVIQDNVNKETKCDLKEIAALLKSFSSLGYTLNQESILKLIEFSSSSLAYFYHTYFPLLKEVAGCNVKHTIFYKNFPDMKNISDLEYYYRAALHYLTASENSDGFMNQDIDDFNRMVVSNENKIILQIITISEAKKILVEICENYFEGKTAIPNSERSFLTMILNEYKDLIVINDIPFKENIAIYFDCLLANKNDLSFGEFFSIYNLTFVNTATDLLRVYAAISKGDVTLRNKVQFISLDRKCRRIFINKLDDIAIHNKYIIDEFVQHEFLWKKAFEKLHIGEYENKYPNIFKYAYSFRNNEYVTYYGSLEKNKLNQKKYIELLSQRPGEFARRLDSMIRNVDYDLDYTLESFSKIANKVSTNVLLQLWESFKNRTLYETRIFRIKKSYCDVFKEIEDSREPISQNTINKVIDVIEDALRMIYSSYEKRGNVYLDESLRMYCLPTNARNGSCQNKTLTFGTKIKLSEEDGDFMRVFTHFKNMNDGNNEIERVDVDLSVEFFDDEFDNIISLSWHDMGSGKDFNCYHSGDIISAPKGASEFVDLDYKKAKEYARYLVVVNSVYTGQSFESIPECFSGVMFMNKLGKKGVVFNPEFIANKFDLTQKYSNQNIAFAIDLHKMELIWMDCPLSNGFTNIVAKYTSGVVISLKEALKEHMNLYDFFKLHNGHVNFVDKKEEADIIISDDDDATLKPYDVEKIASLWL